MIKLSKQSLTKTIQHKKRPDITFNIYNTNTSNAHYIPTYVKENSVVKYLVNKLISIT